MRAAPGGQTQSLGAEKLGDEAAERWLPETGGGGSAEITEPAAGEPAHTHREECSKGKASSA